MIGVIFEVWIAPGHSQDYLAIAARLKPELEQMDGFISIERFQSLSEEGKLLSLSFWRDEDCVKAWRNHAEHKKAQNMGRESIFRDYRLRIVQVLRDYGMTDRAEAPKD
jgi:heme-degrading monooxygenase HmoA